MNWTWLGLAAAAFLLISFRAGYKRGFVREVVSLLCVFLSMTVTWFVNPYVNDFVRENTPVYGTVYETVEKSFREFTADNPVLGTAPGKSEQSRLIESLGLPEFLAKGIEENNTVETYRNLAVTTFTDYVAGYLATTAVNGFSFLISFLLGTVLIRLVTWALDLLAKLPVINGVNRIAGAVLGAAKGVLFIWVALLVLTLLGNTELGRAGLKLVEEDSILRFLYENDVLIRVFMNVSYRL